MRMSSPSTISREISLAFSMKSLPSHSKLPGWEVAIRNDHPNAQHLTFVVPKNFIQIDARVLHFIVSVSKLGDQDVVIFQSNILGGVDEAHFGVNRKAMDDISGG